MRFFRLTLILCLLMFAAVGSAVLSAHADSRPDGLHALGFGVCNGKPCFMGITPGVTTWAEALDILEKGGGRHSERGTIFIDHYSIIVDYVPDTQLVSAIIVMDQMGVPLPATAGEALRYLGPPSCFSPNVYSASQLVLIYPHLYVILTFADKRVNPTSPIFFVEISATPIDCMDGAPWPGFTSSDRYVNLYRQVLP